MLNEENNGLCGLTEKERIRLSVIESYIKKEISSADAKTKLTVCSRQLRRIVKQYKLNRSGIVHGLSGRASNNNVCGRNKKAVMRLYKEKYSECSYAHTSDMLLQRDGIKVSHATLRNWLIKSGVEKVKPQKKRYYKRRDPRPRFGEMVQMDGSFHDWFGDGQMLCLIHMVDDATKQSLAILNAGETTLGCLQVLKMWCEKFGVPRALYVDKDSVFRINHKNHQLSIEEQLSGETEHLTEFGKVCKQLGIEIIFANSPQAKGRVERRHAIFQTRFVQELKLDGIKTMEQANDFLLRDGGFLNGINLKFTVEAKEECSACTFLPQAELDKAFTIKHYRKVKNDYTIQFRNMIYQLPKKSYLYTKSDVLITVDLSNNIAIYAGSLKLDFTVKSLNEYKSLELTCVQKQTTKPHQMLGSLPQLSLSAMARKNKHKSPWSKSTSIYSKKEASQP